MNLFTNVLLKLSKMRDFYLYGEEIYLMLFDILRQQLLILLLNQFLKIYLLITNNLC